jgi:hypothetical protein
MLVALHPERVSRRRTGKGQADGRMLAPAMMSQTRRPRTPRHGAWRPHYGGCERRPLDFSSPEHEGREDGWDLLFCLEISHFTRASLDEYPSHSPFSFTSTTLGDPPNMESTKESSLCVHCRQRHDQGCQNSGPSGFGRGLNRICSPGLFNFSPIWTRNFPSRPRVSRVPRVGRH